MGLAVRLALGAKAVGGAQQPQARSLLSRVQSPAPTASVIGFIAAQNFPERKLRKIVRAGVQSKPDATFVTTSSRADKPIREELERLRVEYVALEPNPYWKYGNKDDRHIWTTFELLQCDELAVFHKDGSGRTTPFLGKENVHGVSA
jgi:hypothetical protein